ncbi:MAG: HAD family hydrolase, partial [Erysipelotrichaceae bacterium]|nr:HAD family hydrolase [Erysipelotrichaceae bacterium]
MPKRPLVALMYDFDKTLSPRDMQEYSFIPALNMEASDFWDKCAVLTKKHNMDQILSYMFVMLQEAEKSGMYLNKNEFRNLGKAVQLFDGVETWFKRINDYGESIGLQVEHYILSSGLKEIIEATKIAKEFKKIYASEYCYNEYEEPIWPAMAVNYTSKTQFLFRINKGVLEVTENDELNASMAEENKRISFKNMIYIGDGFTDVPCMKLVKSNGGHSIAV